MKLDVTIAIPVKNEERNLPGCLQAIGKDFVEKIVVIDSGSTDHTKEIAESFGAEYINFTWNGKFPKKRNWYLRNHLPETQWVFFLDADEFLTPKFKEALKKAVNDQTKVGYWLNYSIYFMGRKLKGGYPLRKLALFRVESGEYERIDEKKWSHLDMEIHEHPILTGNIGTIKEKIDHQDFRGVSHYVTKHNEYSSWEASRFLKISKSPDHHHFTWKQRIKYALIRTPLIGPAFFFGSFFVMGGFLDGTKGFAFAILKMAYFTEIYCKINEQDKDSL